MTEHTSMAARLGFAIVVAIVLAWATPFLWMLVAALRPPGLGGAGMASLVPDYVPTLANFVEAWNSADFVLHYVNTIVICGGILLVQLVTIALAGYAFARLDFPGRTLLFYLFLTQLMLVPVVLLVPNLRTIAALGLYDTLPGVMAPYFASAFGTFLMRQTFRSVPRELEEAALIDGARWWHLIRFVYLPLARPAVISFSIISVTTHWNEFLWPLMVINSPDRRPLTVGLMSANFLTDLVIDNRIVAFDDLIKADGTSNEAFIGQFFPALHANAVIDRKVYGAPFHNSTPLLYYNVEHFKEAGLDPDRPPQTWDELIAAARKLTKRDGDRVTRWGIMVPSTYDYGGWMLSALTMSNGGRYFNEDFGGEVYYDTPSTLGALTFWSDLVHKHKVHPAGEQKGPGVSTAFLAGQSSMMLLSTGSLTFVRDSAKFPYKVAFVPRNVRNAVPIGGASLVQPQGLSEEKRKAGWTLIKWLTAPEKSGWWSRATGYFAPNMGAYQRPEMVEFLAKNPDAKTAIDQLAYAKPWFATYKTVAVRKAIEDELQAVLSGKKQPKEALVAAQKAADDLMRPYVNETALRMPALN